MTGSILARWAIVLIVAFTLSPLPAKAEIAVELKQIVA